MKTECKNENYSAIIIKISNITPLPGCNNIQRTIITGNNVIIGKDISIGDLGVYFPVGCKISNEFLKGNNLFRHKELNANIEKVGFFDDSGRVRALRLRGNASDGFWIQIESLLNTEAFKLSQKDIFSLKDCLCLDYINGIELCRKYIPVNQRKTRNDGLPKNQKNVKPKISILKPNQFRLHINTLQLGRNLHQIDPNNIIDISKKIHGTSAVFSRVLCNRIPKWYEKVLLKLGLKINFQYYNNIYSSRKVIKNDKKDSDGFYSKNVWKHINDKIAHLIPNGTTLYGEIVGYIPDSNTMIQKDYDYGCDFGECDFYVYRMTTTNDVGDVFELPMMYVRQWCKERGLKVVPQLFYGIVREWIDYWLGESENINEENFREYFVSELSKVYLEKQCNICKNNVPAEGIVVRIDNTTDIKSFKLKSFSFKERETKLFDDGVIDIEEEQGNSEIL